MFQPSPRRLLVVFGLLLSCASLQAEQVNIATSSNPVKKIVIPTTSGTALVATANELKDFLNRMKSGTSVFVVETFDPAVGPNAGTIVLGTAANLNLATQLDDTNVPALKERERFLLASANSGTNIVIAGNSELAISHGVFDLLERMGCSWYMPTAAWEVIPAASATVRWTTPTTPLSTPTVTMGTKSMALKIYHDETPDYKSRSLTAAFHNSSGGNNAHEWQQQWDESVAWNKHNKQAQGLKINNAHNYANIVAWAKSQTQAPNDPVNGRWKTEYYALVNGQRGDSSNPKEPYVYQLCVSNTGVWKLAQDYAVAWLAANPTQDSISMEPNDGVNYWCSCTSSPGSPGGCAALKWKKAYSPDTDPNNDNTFVTDRVVLLANKVAEHLATTAYSDKYVGILSYAKHSGPPSLTIHPKIYVKIANGYLSGGYTISTLLSGWAEQWVSPNTPNIGIYDYYSLYGGDLALPNLVRGSDLKYMKDNYPVWHQGVAKADMYEAESSFSYGMMGLGQYVTMKLLWNTDTDVEALRKDFLTKCFGADTTPIYATMDQFFKHVDRGNGYQLSTDLIGRLFGWIDDAYGQTSDPKVIARLDALAVWVKYCEMRRTFDSLPDSQVQAAAEDLLIYLWKIRATSMVDTLCAWKSQSKLGNSTDPAKDIFDWPTNSVVWPVYAGTNWPIGTLDLDAGIPGPMATTGTNGVLERQPWKVSGTFSHTDIAAIVTQGILDNPTLSEEPRIYDHDLVPSGFSGTGVRGSFNQFRLKKIGLYLLSGTSGVLPTLDMSTGHSQNKGNIPYTLYANDGISDLQTGTLLGTTGSFTITFGNESPNSIYIMDMYEYNAGTRMSWPAGTKISMMARSDWPYSCSGGQRRYFYVPKGTKNIIAYAYSINACTFRTADNAIVYSQPTASNGVDISFPINDTQDEQVWSIQNIHAQTFFFQNIPGVLATRQDELLLPKEAFAELIPSGGSGTATRGSFLKMNGSNAFYLRGDALGILPTLSISGTMVGAATGTSKWRLLSEDGKTEFVSGTFVRTSTPVTYTIPINSGTGIVPTSTTDSYLLVYDDNKTNSTINWTAGAKVTIAASQQYKHTQSGGVTRRYFFVPKGTKQVVYQARSILVCDVYTMGGTKKYDQDASSNPITTQIPVGPGEDNQFWYFTTSFGAGDFYFTTIPGLLSARPDEMLVPKWTTKVP